MAGDVALCCGVVSEIKSDPYQIRFIIHLEGGGHFASNDTLGEACYH